MSIHSVGSDITNIDRLQALHERRGDALLKRLFTAEEQAYCDARKARFTHYAGLALAFAVAEVL